MSALTRALALGTLPLAAVLSLGMLVARPSSPTVLQAAPPPGKDCSQLPVFKPGYQSGENSVTSHGKGFHFGSEAWVEATVCSAGTLVVTAQGELGGVEKPQLTVLQDGNILVTPTFDQERAVKIRIPSSGKIMLGYFNDFYDMEARIIFIGAFKLLGSGCQDLLQIEFVPGRGVNMNLAAHTASLAVDLPLTLTPCRAGELQLLLRGREGNGALPILKITQGGKELYRKPVGTTWQPLSLDVQRQPLTLRLINPYWKTLADRNLNVRRLEFVPDPAR